MARSIRRVPAAAVLALACAATWPGSAGAVEISVGATTASVGSIVEPLLAVPAATLPALNGVPAAPAKPSDTGAGTGAPLAFIKDRVELRVFRGTVISVSPSSARMVVAVTYHSLGRTIRRRQAFTLRNASLQVADANGDGKGEIADIQRGDRVRVRAAISRGPHKSSQALPARDVLDRGQALRESRRGRRLR